MKRRGAVSLLLVWIAGSLGFAASMWSWVLNFDPGFAFSHQPAPSGSALSSSVTVLLVDGLRVDASRRMPALNALRALGADIEAQVGTPSFSRPGRATLVVGAPPSVHGVTTNRQQRALVLDHLIRRVGASGGTCRIAGSKIWSGLFGDDIAHCGVYRSLESKEGPGAFIRQVPAMRAAQREGLAFVLLQPATLRILDLTSTDFAAHEYGGASPEYEAEVARADRVVADLMARLDLAKETLVVTADHGHRDLGGHGGQEPEVLAIPVVMAGAGIRPGSSLAASQTDIAPTLAALLGLPLPTASSGHPLAAVLQAGEETRAVLAEASIAQARAFEDGVSRRLGVPLAEDGTTDFQSLIHTYKHRVMEQRTGWGILLTVVLVLCAIAAIRLARPDLRGLAAGGVTLCLLAAGPVRWLTPPLTFSAINYDEMLVGFFARIMMTAAAAVAIAILAALMVARFRRDPPAPSGPALAGSVGVLAGAPLAGLLLASWLHHGLLLPMALPGPDRMVEAYAYTLALASVSFTALLILSLLPSRDS